MAISAVYACIIEPFSSIFATVSILADDDCLTSYCKFACAVTLSVPFVQFRSRVVVATFAVVIVPVAPGVGAVPSDAVVSLFIV